jgi:hypothetical protein
MAKGMLHRLVRGTFYVLAGGLFLLAVHVRVFPPAEACTTEQGCVPMYLWPLLGMAFCGAMAASTKEFDR